jgi:hypothetical protein
MDRGLHAAVERVRRGLLECQVAGDDSSGICRPDQRDAGEAHRHHHDQRDEQHDAALLGPAGSMRASLAPAG